MTPAERIDAATELMELAEAMQRGVEADLVDLEALRTLAEKKNRVPSPPSTR